MKTNLTQTINWLKNCVSKDVDDILYDIGLSFNSCRDEPKKRRLIYHPGLILAINVINIIFVAINYYMNSTNELVAYALFDIDYFLGLKHRAKFTQLIAMTTVLFNQCIYYYNYKRGIEPSFLRIFQLMTGLFFHVTVSKVELCILSNVYYFLPLELHHVNKPSPLNFKGNGLFT